TAAAGRTCRPTGLTSPADEARTGGGWARRLRPADGWVAAGVRAGPALAGDLVVHLDVAFPRRGHDRLGDLGSGRLLVPAGAGRPVAHELLVRAVLGPARLPVVGPPEPRRVGREQLVGEQDLAVGGT